MVKVFYFLKYFRITRTIPCHTIGRLTVNPSLFLNPSSTLDQSLGVTDGASSFPIDFSADISSMQPCNLISPIQFSIFGLC